MKKGNKPKEVAESRIPPVLPDGKGIGGRREKSNPASQDKPKVLHGLLTKKEICQICQITSDEFDYHMPLLMKAGLVNCYVEK